MKASGAALLLVGALGAAQGNAGRNGPAGLEAAASSAPDLGRPSVGVQPADRQDTFVGSALVAVRGPSVAEVFQSLRDGSSATMEHAGDERARFGAAPAGLVGVAAREATMAAALSAADADARDAQEPVIAAAQALGVKVVSRYTAATNGMLVHATAKQLGLLARHPAVVGVSPAPLVRPNLAFSVPHIGATALAESLGYDGTETYVAVVDSGVDYTHAALGGPGTRAAYEAAAMATEIITDTFEGELLYPTAKVVGGWDFVGRRYNPPWLCPPEQEASGVCTTTPEPDPDPLDTYNHGTHVAGIVASIGTEQRTVYPGVAPGALIVALKLFSTPPNASPDEEVDVVVDTLEWATRVNLGLSVPGIAPPRVDVFNMSLGEPWAQGSFMFDAAVEAATGVGIVVVASAGNSGNIPFVVGSPSTSPAILSVASATAPGEAYKVVFSWPDGGSEVAGSQGNATLPLEESGRVEAELAWLGRACADDASVQNVAERIALIERGTCTMPEKILRAQTEGAVGVIVFTNDGPRQGLVGSNSGVTIPGLMIDRDPGTTLRALLESNVTVTAVMDSNQKVVDAGLADAISSFSSRGPSKHGALKPDLTAPGTAIVSARRGQGDGGVGSSGTSMSSPHVAGAAAILAQRAAAEGLELEALDIAALLMNYALPTVTDVGSGGVRQSVARQGAGRVDVMRSGGADVIVRAGDIASINLGVAAIDELRRISRTVTLRNLSDTPKRFRVESAFRQPELGPTVEVHAPDPIDVAAGAERSLTIDFDVRPELLPIWPFNGTVNVFSAGQVEPVEVDGYLEFVELNAAAEPVPDAVNPRVPFYLLARWAGAVSSAGVEVPDDDGRSNVRFVNRSSGVGRASLFLHGGEDPDEPDVLGELDIRHVGVRAVGPVADITTTQVSFVVSLWEPAPIPFNTRLEVYVDTDGDAVADRRIRNGTQMELSGSGSTLAFVVGVTPWDGVAGVAAGEEVVVGPMPVDAYARTRTLTVPLSALGLDALAPLEFYVVHRGTTEDWIHILDVTADVAPDGAGGPGNMVGYKVDVRQGAWRPSNWDVVLPPRSTLDVPLIPTGATDGPRFLAVYPANDFDLPDAAAAVLPEGITPQDDTSRLLLPALYMRHELRPAGADDVIRAAMTALASSTARFRMTYDLTDNEDTERSALREYEFDHDHGVDVVTRYKSGVDAWHIRYLSQGYVHLGGINWRCAPIEWFMFLRPDFIAKLQADFPARGWTADGRARNDPSLLQFRASDPGRDLTFLIQVPEAGGPPIVLSWTRGDLANPRAREVFRLREINGSGIEVGAPRGAVCP